MIELYLLIALAGAGYVLSTSAATSSVAAAPLRAERARPFPSHDTVYASKHLDRVRDTVTRAATAKYAAAVQTAAAAPGQQERPAVVGRERSRLSGLETDMQHNNMLPFFSGSVKQNVRTGANDTLLETYTGAFSTTSGWQPKREAEPLFAPEQSAVLPDASPLSDFLQGRYEVPTARNNEAPVEPVRVGPGLGRGFEATPHRDDLEMRGFAMPKTVDELRQGSNPRVTYDARTVEGMGPTVRAMLPNVAKRTPDAYWCNERGDVPTRATFEMPPAEELPEVRDTNRVHSTDYTGTAQAAEPHAMLPALEGAERSVKSRAGGFGTRNVGAGWAGRGEVDDYGREAIWYGPNERTTTCEDARGSSGNLTTAVKSMFMPVLDVLRVTRKAFTADLQGNAFGQMHAQIPSKQTVWDPNNVARTTLKETMVDDDSRLNLKGAVRVAVYDPEAVARTTLRETMPGWGDIARNPSRSANRGASRQAGDAARVTHRQTTEELTREGNVDGAQRGRGGYEATAYDAPYTQRHDLSDRDYIGGGYAGDNDGYKVTDMVAPPTQKAQLSDREYKGNAADQTTHATMSYEDIYNATMNQHRETVLQGRAPTQVGAALGIGRDAMPPADTRRLAGDESRTAFAQEEALGRAHYQHSRTQCPGEMRVRSDATASDRLDASIMSALQGNPFNHNIAAPA